MLLRCDFCRPRHPLEAGSPGRMRISFLREPSGRTEEGMCLLPSSVVVIPAFDGEALESIEGVGTDGHIG